MRKTLFTLAALAMIMVSCTQDNIEIEQEDNRTFIVSAAMPKADDAQTRVSLTPDAETANFGLDLKWEEDDKLMLCFEQDGTYYHNDAPIVASTISDDGKTAQFAITVPSEISANATFDCEVVYQKPNSYGGANSNGGFFESVDGVSKFKLVNRADQGVTLDKPGSTQSGIMRPMVYDYKKGITKNGFGNINLKHSGWVMALHFKNTSSSSKQLPAWIIMSDLNEKGWTWNGRFSYNASFFEVSTHSFSNTGNKLYSELRFRIAESDWMPFYGKEILSGNEVIFYRWVTSLPSVPKLRGELSIGGDIVNASTETFLDPKTVEIGKVYHVYTTWNGTEFEFSPSTTP